MKFVKLPSYLKLILQSARAYYPRGNEQHMLNFVERSFGPC